MIFTKNNIIFPSKKLYENIKEIDKNLRSLYMHAPTCSSYTFINRYLARTSLNKFNHTLDKIKKSINKFFKKVEIKDLDNYFNETFPGITAFLYEGYCNEETANEPLAKRFIKLAINLENLVVWDKNINPHNKILIFA